MNNEIKLYIFDIPSTCKEVFEVKARSKEEAAKFILDLESEKYEHYIPESEFSEEVNEFSIMEYLRE